MTATLDNGLDGSGVDGAPMSEAMSSALMAFLRQHIRSLELVEVLLFLHRYPEAAFASDAIAGELRLQPRSVSSRCSQLKAIGLVGEDSGRCRFLAASPHAAVVGELALVWASHRARVIETISPDPPTTCASSLTPSSSGERSETMAEAVYFLCALTSLLCAAMLTRSWWLSRSRLSLCSAICFVGLVLNNVMLIVDKVITGPTVDLSVWTKVPAVVGLAVFLLGLILDGES